MAARVLCCAIEELGTLHPKFYLDSHIAAFVAVTGQYSVTPASFQVKCHNVESQWLGGDSEFTLELSWTEESVNKAERLRATVQQHVIVELATVGVALLLAPKVLALAGLNVTRCGDRVDYLSQSAQCVLEASGTETLAELGRRHRAKVTQALANPMKWRAHVVVCAFAEEGHQIRVSTHEYKEDIHATKKG